MNHQQVFLPAYQIVKVRPMRHLLMSLVFAVTASVAVAQDGQQLSTEQWGTTNDDGRIEGVVVSPSHSPDSLQPGDVKVSLVSQSGEIYRAEPLANSDLGFTVDEVPAGVYTLVARGPNLVACYAMHIVENTDGSFAPNHQLIEVAAADLELDAVRHAVIRYMPSTVAPVPEFDASAAASIMTGQNDTANSRFTSTNGGMSGRIYGAGLTDGKFDGGSMTNVMVYKQSKLIDKTVTDETGIFTFEELEPGSYSLVAIGAEGIGITSFRLDEAVTETADVASNSAGRLVSFQGPANSPQFELQLAPSGLDSPAIQELIDDQQEDPEAEPGLQAESPLGPGGGGGGGGGGAGGSGGLLGITAAAIGIAALAGDDDGNSFTPPPVTSPVTP